MGPGLITAAELDSRFLGGLADQAGRPVAGEFKGCIQCGTCTATCPSAVVMEHPPRRMVRMAALGLWRDLFSANSVWQCLTCASCQARCPRGVKIADGVLALRREFGRRVGLPEGMGRLASVVSSDKNITGDPNDNRNLWVDDLDMKPPLADEAAGAGVTLDAVYFVGCVASLFPAVYGIPRSVAGLLSRAGLKFAVMGGDEWCCGFPLIGAGATEGDAPDSPNRIEDLVRHNVDVVRRSGASRLVTSCPSCYHTWKHTYNAIYGSTLGFEVVHASELLAEVVDGGRLNLNPQEMVVTYHDPCDLGRKSGIFDAPRALLRAVPGLELKEMRFHGPDSKCCGGGGNLEMNDPALSGEIARSRLAQAASTGAAVLASSCQQCKRTLQGAARRDKVKIRVMDVSEVLLKSVTGE
ncbi:MAG: (Fe-S)-binding protein [Firmicutes bacterium]|nr:(Fe-S)-binding protein [Bacillota bacterium]